MEKLYSVILALLFALQANAQFKIHSNGYMSFMTTATPLSPISLNCNGNANYFARYEGVKNGLYLSTTGGNNAATVYLAPNSTINYALRAQISSPDTSDVVGSYAMGVWGQGGRSMRNYGVVGTITKKNGSKGAGIYGADHALWASTFSKDYAGYFDGDVYVYKDLEVGGTIQGVFLGNSASASSSTRENFMEQKATLTPTAEQLSQLDLTTFIYPSEVMRGISQIDRDALLADSTIDEAMIQEAEAARKPTYIQKQKLSKHHYALDANQLEKIFPDLVYEQEDGSKSINYVEMIPILVKTISDLNDKVARLNEKIKNYANNAQQAKTNAYTRSASTESERTVSAVLEQNTPNPFKEQTTIRFKLPEDVTDAAICIFDMTGKLLKKMPISSQETSVNVNGWELGEGMFLYTLMMYGKEVNTKKMIIMR